MKQILFAAAALLAATPAMAQKQGTITVRSGDTPVVQGSGSLGRDVRSLAPFSAITVDGPVDVEVAVGKPPAAQVEADDNLLKQITTRVENGVLKVSVAGSFVTRRNPLVQINLPALSRIELIGSGNAGLFDLNGGEIVLHAAGSGGFRAEAGRVDRLKLAVSGSGASDVAGLKVADAQVGLMGSGTIRVRARQSMVINLSGSGSVLYGGAAKPEVRVTGSGHVRRFD